ncbi:MAG: hypothetical protein Q8P84_04955, partial [Deltaproteobacteria bacterium]|nr:hypothetical protein [Deltaproteobacteria bacterium]
MTYKLQKKRVFGLLSSVFGLFLINGCGSSDSGGTTVAAQTVGGDATGEQTSTSVMSAGDVMYVSFGGNSASVDFSGASGSFELLLQSQATDAASKSITLSALSAGKSFFLSESSEEEGLEEPLLPSAQSRLESVLRDEERLLMNVAWDGGNSQLFSSVSASAGKSVGGGGGPSAAVSVNDTGTFRVLSSLTTVTSYTTVNATAKCVNDTVAIYIDDEITSTNPSDLPQADIDTLCASFKTSLATTSSLFGGYSDINDDGVAVALITPAVNRLGAASGGIVTGFFYAGDLFARSSSIPASNYREIVYLVSPDSDGVYGTKITNAFAMSNFLPAVFPHEMQHLINYYQRTIVRSGSAEENWLNEALSHLTEDLVGYGRENYSRYSLYLASPQSYALVASSSPSLAQRGAGYLFLRYLYEQSSLSATFLKNMVQTTNSGVDNVVAAYPSKPADFDSFGEFLRRWAVAVAYTNRGLTTNSKFIYNARTLNSTTGNYEGV